MSRIAQTRAPNDDWIHPSSAPSGSVELARQAEAVMVSITYNAQLGSQWATSPTTGERYLLDYATQWSASGPGVHAQWWTAGAGSRRPRRSCFRRPLRLV